MTQFNWHQTGEFEKHIRSTPEVHDCEWERDITPWWHEAVIYLKWIGPLFFAIFALLYAGRELMEPLGKVWEWLGLPTW